MAKWIETCPTCGQPVERYEPDEWPKAVKLPDGREETAHSPEHVEELMAPFRPREQDPAALPLVPDGPVDESTLEPSA